MNEALARLLWSVDQQACGEVYGPSLKEDFDGLTDKHKEALNRTASRFAAYLFDLRYELENTWVSS